MKELILMDVNDFELNPNNYIGSEYFYAASMMLAAIHQAKNILSISKNNYENRYKIREFLKKCGGGTLIVLSQAEDTPSFVKEQILIIQMFGLGYEIELRYIWEI
jgi:hypothetical protein